MQCSLQNFAKKYNRESSLSSHMSRCHNLKEYWYDEQRQNGSEGQLESDSDMTLDQYDELHQNNNEEQAERDCGLTGDAVLDQHYT